MASKRILKKDIKFLTTQIIEECYTCSYLFPEVEEAKIDEIINDSLSMYKSLIKKINQPGEIEGKGAVKKLYKGVYNDLISTSDVLLGRLNILASPK